MASAVEDLNTNFGGRGGNLADMRYIRLKIKTLKIEDNDLLQQLIQKGFALNVTLPLADVYQKTISAQTIKLSNYDVISLNEFEFTSLSVYNFKVSEETFGPLSQSEITIFIDENAGQGSLLMGKLLLSPNFQLKTIVNLSRTVEVKEQVQPSKLK